MKYIEKLIYSDKLTNIIMHRDDCHLNIVENDLRANWKVRFDKIFLTTTKKTNFQQ